MGKLLDNLLPSVGSFVQAPLNYGFERLRAKRELQDSKELTDYQYSKDLQQWERENLYNSPTQQMQRLREAGLNPAMIYGSSGAKTVSASSPKYQAPRPQYREQSPIDVTNVIGQYQDFQMKNAQIDLVRNQALKAKKEAENAGMYYYNRAGLMNASANIKRGQESWHTFGQDEWRNKPESAMSMWDRQQLAKMMQTNATTDNIIANKARTDQQIEWYLWSKFSGLAIRAAKTVLGGAKGLLKPGLKGGRLYGGKNWYGQDMWQK